MLILVVLILEIFKFLTLHTEQRHRHWKNDITLKKIVKDLDLNTIKDRAVGDGKRIVGGVYSIIDALKTRVDPLENVDIVICYKLVKIHEDNSLEFENGVIVDSSDSVTFLAIPPRLLIDIKLCLFRNWIWNLLCKNTPTWSTPIYVNFFH